MPSPSTCTFCLKEVLETDFNHNCTQKKFHAFFSMFPPKSDSLDGITNLVFQGGGVKGVAYIGALLQLQKEARKNGRDFLGGVRRIAGTSAGSFVALYLALNMSVDEITPLMKRSYSSLLDEGLVLKVKVKKGFWGVDHKNFKAKDIFLRALEYFEDWSKKINENPDLRSVQEKELKEAINKMFKYYGEKMGFLPQFAIKVKGSKYAADAAKWLMGLLHPPKMAEPAKVNEESKTFDLDQENIKKPPGQISNLSQSHDQDTTRRTTVSTGENYLSFASESLLNPHTSYQQTSTLNANPLYPSEENQGYQEIAEERQTESERFQSFPKQNNEESVVSGENTGANVFEEIISKECSGILSDNDKLELSNAQKSSYYSTISSTSLSQNSCSDSLGSVVEAWIQEKQISERVGKSDSSYFERKNPALERTAHFSSSNSLEKKSEGLEIAETLVGSSHAKIGKRSRDPQVKRSSPRADSKNRSKDSTFTRLLPESVISNSTQLETEIPNQDILLSRESAINEENSVKEIDRAGFVHKEEIRTVELTIRNEDTTRKEVKIQSVKEVSKETNGSQEEPCEISQKNVTPAKKAAAEEYIEREKIKIEAASKEELTGAFLPAALGEILWFLIFSQQNAAGIQEQLGLFDGSEVQSELIEKPILEALQKLNLKPKDNITFKELMDYNEFLSKGEKFKQFYVTAFNTKISRTEVFSAERTPNVVIADAVRASMSIPVFFTPKPIREKIQEGDEIKYRGYCNGVKFMDGGIFDNYPLYIFEDIKYCFDEDFECGSQKGFENPNTLGFRLLDGDTIEKYTNPNFVNKTKLEEEKQFKETFSYQIGLLLNAVANESQENDFFKMNGYKRSVYINNNGVSAIAFNLSESERNSLIESGKNGVKNFLKRAKNNFSGEDQAR